VGIVKKGSICYNAEVTKASRCASYRHQQASVRCPATQEVRLCQVYHKSRLSAMAGGRLFGLPCKYAEYAREAEGLPW
jgi:hypothetical protein